MLPFKQAIKLPFDFYYKVRFVELTGKVILKNNVQRGAIQIGRAGSDFLAKTESVISIKGNLIFNGPIFIGNGVTLEVNEGATVEFGKSVRITARTKIISQEQITIKDNVGISWESQIIDSNFHYIRNTKTGVIHKKSVPVVIGANCWIGNRVSIGKGVIAVAFGHLDYITDLGGRHDKAENSIFTVRSMIAIAAKANNIVPIDTIHPRALKDLEDLKLRLESGRDLGYEGMLCLNPIELELVNQYYSPSEKDVKWALEIIGLSTEAVREGKGVALMNGKFIGPPLIAMAKNILKKNKLIQSPII